MAMTGWPRHLLLASLAMVMAGTALHAAESGPPALLGQNLAGESCRATGRPTSSQPLAIMCGTTIAPAATLQLATLAATLPQDIAAGHDAILHVVQSIAGGTGGAGRMTCDGGQWLGEGANNTVLVLCTLNSNSWPQIIVASARDRTLYQAEGLPTMLPVLQEAVASAFGRPVPAAEMQAGLQVLEARLPRQVYRSSSTDFSSYKQLVEIGRLYSGADNYAGAENAYRTALEIETRIFGPGGITVGETLAELGLQVSNQRRFDEAAALFRRATPIIQASPNVGARARLSSYLALDAANQRRFADALKFAQDATAARRAEGGSGFAGGGDLPATAPSRGELAHSLQIEAEMAMRLDDLPAAQAAAEEALWIVSQEPGLPLWWRADAVLLMAELNERQGRVVVAERDFQDGLKLQQTLFGDSAPVARTELRIGKFYSDQQLYTASALRFRAAFAILAKDPVARSQIVPEQIAPFIAAASVLARDPRQRPLLDAEIFRAVQFVESDVAGQTIVRASARLAAGNPSLADLIRQTQEAQRQRDNFRVDLAAEYAKPDDERRRARELDLANEVRLAQTRLDELSTRLQQAFPDYTRFADPGPAELADVQAQLRSGEAFLSFVIGVRSSYALLVTRDGLSTKALDVTAESLAADIGELRRAFTPQLGAFPDFDLKTSFALYHRLLGPFENDLANITHLIVAPNGDLASLPFALLVTASPTEGAERSYAQAAWLVRRLALSEVPSPRAFLSLRSAQASRIRAPKPFLGFGDPLLAGVTTQPNTQSGNTALNLLSQVCHEGGPMPPGLLRALPALPDTAGELNAVAKILGGDSDSVLLGADAAEPNLYQHALDQYGVLYFATHGLLPGELHCQTEPGLVLSPPEQPATATNADGLLDASEIAGLKLNADLVVLSACNTAAAPGGRFGGGALQGLSGAFFNAGARAVLASHWEVPSAATVQLMTGLFEMLGRDGRSDLAEALRQSQLALIAQPATAHPVSWAAFTLIGNSAP
jgi:CHAT domain-containing protein/tetratricopeptide (TPR) repeat protein